MTAVGAPVRVSDDLFRVLEASQKLAAETGGAFDVTLGPVIRLWREARKNGHPPAEEALAEARGRTGYVKLHLDSGRQAVKLDQAGMQVDLGAIGKGYAADEALAVLAKLGIGRALVAMSGGPGFRRSAAGTSRLEDLDRVADLGAGECRGVHVGRCRAASGCGRPTLLAHHRSGNGRRTDTFADRDGGRPPRHRFRRAFDRGQHPGAGTGTGVGERTSGCGGPDRGGWPLAAIGALGYVAYEMNRIAASLLIMGCLLHAADDRLVFSGKSGPGKGKRIVLISGDEEYRSEQALPQLAKILSGQHGFDCTVLFALDPDGTINPTRQDNIPGLETVDSADLVIMLMRFRDLPDRQMKHIVDYVEAGRPIVGFERRRMPSS